MTNISHTKIAVVGATGEVGRHVVADARRRGLEVVAVARSAGVDVATGHGLREALAGVETVIDVLSVTTMSAATAKRFFTVTTQRLLAAEKEMGVRHHVALSIIGVDRAPYDYYAGKLAQERLVTRSAVPWSLLRAAQFHEFAAQLYARTAFGPLHPAPRMRTQPVAAQEVGEHLMDIAIGGPQGRMPDLAGPREEDLVQMIRGYARSRGLRAWIPAISLPGAFGRAQRDGSLLPGPGAIRGRQTFDEWLEEERRS